MIIVFTHCFLGAEVRCQRLSPLPHGGDFPSPDVTEVTEPERSTPALGTTMTAPWKVGLRRYQADPNSTSTFWLIAEIRPWA